MDNKKIIYDCYHLNYKVIGDNGDCWSVAAHPFERKIAFSSNYKIYWINLDSNKIEYLYECQDKKEDIISIDYSPDGKYLASASKNGKFLLWDNESYTFKQSNPNNLIPGITMENTEIINLTFSPFGKYIACILNDDSLRIYSLENGNIKNEKIYDIQEIYEPYSNKEIHPLWLSFNNDESKLAISFDNNFVLQLDLYNIYNPLLLSNILSDDYEDKFVYCLDYSPIDKSILIAVDEFGIIRIWKIIDNKFEMIGKKIHDESINTIVFSPNGKRIVTVSDDGVKIWDVEELYNNFDIDSLKLIKELYIENPLHCVVNKFGDLIVSSFRNENANHKNIRIYNFSKIFNQ